MQAGRWLQFEIAGDRYALPVEAVAQVVALAGLRPVGSAGWAGLLSVRSGTVPLADGAALVGNEERVANGRGLVLRGRLPLGFTADDVLGLTTGVACPLTSRVGLPELAGAALPAAHGTTLVLDADRLWHRLREGLVQQPDGSGYRLKALARRGSGVKSRETGVGNQELEGQAPAEGQQASPVEADSIKTAEGQQALPAEADSAEIAEGLQASPVEADSVKTAEGHRALPVEADSLKTAERPASRSRRRASEKPSVGAGLAVSTEAEQRPPRRSGSRGKSGARKAKAVGLSQPAAEKAAHRRPEPKAPTAERSKIASKTVDETRAAGAGAKRSGADVEPPTPLADSSAQRSGRGLRAAPPHSESPRASGAVDRQKPADGHRPTANPRLPTPDSRRSIFPGGPVLVFHAGLNVDLAVPLEQVLEVGPDRESRPLPNGPTHLAGLVQWRGRLLPLVDLARRMGAGTDFRQLLYLSLSGRAAPAVAVRIGHVAGRAMVPTVLPPSAALGLPLQWVRGVARLGQRPLAVLDPDSLVVA